MLPLPKIDLPEAPRNIRGVAGIAKRTMSWPFNGRDLPTFSTQTWGASRPIRGYGPGGTIAVELRFDDNCRNGHNTFTITASVYTPASRRRNDCEAGGCLHEDIARVFPELAPLIKWHLVSTDGPLHYVANTLYHASDRDHNGLLKGESRQIRNGKTGQLCWILETPKAERYVDADECPPPPGITQYVPWCRIGEGKARELDHARGSAVWPEATDEQLMQDPAVLKLQLQARLPGLLVEFREAMASCGFHWSITEVTP